MTAWRTIVSGLFVALCSTAVSGQESSPSLRIVAPPSYSEAPEGSLLPVFVSLEPIGPAIIGVDIDGGRAEEAKASAPYSWDLRVPSQTAGLRELKAVGRLSDGTVLEAEPILIEVVPALPVAQLEAPNKIEFEFVGERKAVDLSLVLGGGERRNLGPSAMLSAAMVPAGVASFDRGVLTAVSPGWTNLSLEYSGRAAVIAVFVARVPPGDLDADLDVDSNDLVVLRLFTGDPASTPADARDLDLDGVISPVDEELLQELCTREECSLE